MPEINYKYIEMFPENINRYYGELVHKFNDPIRVIVYCVSFVFLGLHLSHGFSSSMKSLGVARASSGYIKLLGNLYSVLIPSGFCLIAIYHHLFSN